MAFIAVDIGNTRAKFGYFFGDRSFSYFTEMVRDCEDLFDWLATLPHSENESLLWRVAQTVTFSDWPKWEAQLKGQRPDDVFQHLTWENVPLKIDVEFPEKVGIDRLLAAFAALSWKKIGAVPNHRPMLIVDAGTAVTIDLLNPEGVFGGGAIFPGFSALAESLASISPKLPLLNTEKIKLPVYPAKNTEDALAAGTFWGTVGLTRQLYEFAAQKFSEKPFVFLTGGAANALVPGLLTFLDEDQLVPLPYMVLSGIAFLAHDDTF